MKKSSKIYVAGHSGLVGSAIVKRLKALGFNNIVTSSHDKLDLTRQDKTEAFFKKEEPEYVFLAAGKVGGILANDTYKADFIYENTAIALNVIHSAYKYGIKKLLNLGSACIYPKNAPQPLKEEYLLTGELEPTNEPYAVAKILAVKLCRYYNEQYNTNFISIMPTNLYGLNDNFDLFTAHALPALIRKFHLAKLLSRGEYSGIIGDLKFFDPNISIGNSPRCIELYLKKFGIQKSLVTLWGSGAPYREFMHAGDAADACIFLMQKYSAREAGEIVNAGSGEEMRIRELAVMIGKIVGYEGDVVWDRSKPDGTPRKMLDQVKMRDLGWQSKISLDVGIQEVYTHYTNKQK